MQYVQCLCRYSLSKWGKSQLNERLRIICAVIDVTLLGATHHAQCILDTTYLEKTSKNSLLVHFAKENQCRKRSVAAAICRLEHAELRGIKYV